jgi:hypothetical protein
LFQRLTVEQNRGHMEFNRESQELEAEIRDLEGQLYYRAGLEYGDLVAVERTLTEVLLLAAAGAGVPWRAQYRGCGHQTRWLSR